MQQTNERLRAVLKRLSEEKYLIAQKERLNKRRIKHKGILESLKIQLLKEEKDVDALSHMSISKFIHTLMNDMSEKLEKEQREALDAKLAVDKELAVLAAIDEEEKSITLRLLELADTKKEYALLIEKKKQLIMLHMPDVMVTFTTYQEALELVEDEIVELNEAIDAGKEVMSKLQKIDTELDSAESWGTFDILGGGMIATLAKRNHMDEAQSMIHDLIHILGRFSQELTDVDESALLDIEFSSYFGAADYFLDGFFVDFAVQSQIHYVQKKIATLTEQMEGIVQRLEKRRSDIILEQTVLSEKCKALLETA